MREFFSILNGEPDITPAKGEKDPLRLAIDNQNTNVLIKLLSCAPDLNVADESGITPALATAFSDNLDALQYLCYYGADISAKANGGMDIFRLAYLAKSYDIIGLMGISLHETMLDMPLPSQTRQILLEYMSATKNNNFFNNYKEINNIFTPDDFILTKIRKMNTSAVTRTLSMGLSTPNAETSIVCSKIC